MDLAGTRWFDNVIVVEKLTLEVGLYGKSSFLVDVNENVQNLRQEEPDRVDRFRYGYMNSEGLGHAQNEC